MLCRVRRLVFILFYADLTPSASNTPVHEIKTDAKKQLIELFHESDSDGSEDETPIFDLPQNSANKSLSFESVADIVFRSVTVPKTNSNPSRTRKAAQFAQHCCLPKLVRSLSRSERKRRWSSYRWQWFLLPKIIVFFFFSFVGWIVTLQKSMNIYVLVFGCDQVQVMWGGSSQSMVSLALSL